MEYTKPYNVIYYSDDDNTYFCNYNTLIYNNISINPLHQALQIGNIYLAEKLSRDPSMLTCVDHKSGYYPLHTACSKPDVKSILLDILEYNYIVKLLESMRINYYKLTRAECIYIIREAISGNKIDDNIDTYLPKIREIMTIEVQIVKMLLDRGADINCIDEKYSLKPLYNAIESRNVDMVKLLLTYGADPNELTPNNYTSLDYAILYGTIDIFKTLMSVCNDITKKNTYYINAFMYGNAEISSCILDMGLSPKDIDAENYDSALHYACHNVSLNKLIKRLIDIGYDVNAKNRDGDTPLHILCMSDCETYYIKVLIDSGADINSFNSYGNSPLHIVTNMESHDKVKLLLALGADVNIKGYYGKTPLHIAVKSGNLGIVDTLVNSGSNVNCKDYNDESALHFAFYSYNSTSITKLLLDKGADINALNTYLYTPLYRACSVIENTEDKLNSIKLLIDRGADVNGSLINNNYRSLLCHVNDFPQIVKLLLDNGLDPNNNAILEDYCFTNITSIKYVILHIALQYYISGSIKGDGFIRNLECIKKDSIKKEIWDECNNELNVIFNTKINRSYFLSIFLTSNNFELLSKLVENNIIRKLNVSDFKNYGQKLDISIYKARYRNELISKAIMILDMDINSGWNLLPYEIKRYILGIMKNEDLMNLV